MDSLSCTSSGVSSSSLRPEVSSVGVTSAASPLVSESGTATRGAGLREEQPRSAGVSGGGVAGGEVEFATVLSVVEVEFAAALEFVCASQFVTSFKFVSCFESDLASALTVLLAFALALLESERMSAFDAEVDFTLALVSSAVFTAGKSGALVTGAPLAPSMIGRGRRSTGAGSMALSIARWAPAGPSPGQDGTRR